MFAIKDRRSNQFIGSNVIKKYPLLYVQFFRHTIPAKTDANCAQRR